MVHPNTKFLRAVGTMIGSVIGVGVFGLPYAFSRSGYLVGALWLLAMAALVTVLQLMYAEVAYQTPGNRRLVGYVEKFLGPQARLVAAACLAGSLWGGMLAYMIAGGRFLHVLLSPVLGGSEFVYAILIWVIASCLIWRGLRFAAKLEVGIVCALLFLFAFIILAAAPHMQVANLSTINWARGLVPYGVVLFALAGMGVIPELKEILGRKEARHLPHAVMIGMTVITLIYFLFATAVVGVTGSATTQIAFDGLAPVLGGTFTVVGALLGTLTILSIAMVIGIELQNTFRNDFGMRRVSSFTLVVGVPLVLYLLGVHAFISVIGFVGGVLAGILGILIVAMYEKMRHSHLCEKHHCLDIPVPLSWALIGVFTIGIVLELFSLFM